MRMRGLRLLTLSVATVMTATALAAQGRQRNVITAEEIARAQPNINTAYDVVQMLRPRWFEKHELARLPGTGAATLQDTPVRVYLNEMNVGDADYLKTIPATNVLELRWLSANETANRYGPTEGHSAIVVTLKHH